MLIVINGKCQSLALFDTLVNTHRMTLCELVEHYANIDEVGAEFTYYTLGYGKSFYGIKFSDRFFGLLGQWCFVM
ncbi:MAG: hypothetical protein JNM67_07860, partial [Bacteroidetes bacterium]|nr:hypothetical protein [Bacteroidota bacterium]